MRKYIDVTSSYARQGSSDITDMLPVSDVY